MRTVLLAIVASVGALKRPPAGPPASGASSRRAIIDAVATHTSYSGGGCGSKAPPAPPRVGPLRAACTTTREIHKSIIGHLALTGGRDVDHCRIRQRRTGRERRLRKRWRRQRAWRLRRRWRCEPRDRRRTHRIGGTLTSRPRPLEGRGHLGAVGRRVIVVGNGLGWARNGSELALRIVCVSRGHLAHGRRSRTKTRKHDANDHRARSHRESHELTTLRLPSLTL